MKLTKIVLIMILFIKFSPTINSQDVPPCTDCWNVPWEIKTDIVRFSPSNCPGCTLIVEYLHRVIKDSCLDNAAYKGTKDLQIKEVWGNSSCNLCFSLQQRYKIAKDSLIRNNIMTPSQRPLFDTVWRVFQTSCWGEWWDPFDKIYKIRGCLPNDICCWELYGIYSSNASTVDSVKRLKIHTQGLLNDCYKWPTPCWFVCDTAYFPPPPPELTSIEGYNSGIYSQIVPNPNNGTFDLKFINNLEDNKDISIRFHNLEGKLIDELHNIIHVKGSRVPINLKNCENGLYYYKITKKNKVIDYGNFVIHK